MTFSLSAVDAQLRREGDAPSIGLVLCRERRNKGMVEYALRDMNKPIGGVGVQAPRTPAPEPGSLPTVEELEAELRRPKGA